MNIEEAKKKIKNECDRLERMLNEDSFSKKEDDIIGVIQAFHDMLYGDAVGTFIKTMKSNRNIFSKTEYNQIKPLLNKWKRNKWIFNPTIRKQC